MHRRPLIAALALVASCGAATMSGHRATHSSATSSTAAAGAVAARPRVALPPVAARADYQLGGAYRPAPGVRIVDRDRGDSAARGVYDICYVNAFQSQPDEKSFWLRRHRSLLLSRHGKLVGDPDWPGEYLLDTSTAAKRRALAAIVGAWFTGCAHKHFAAVEPDNLDSWTRSHGSLTEADNLAYAKLLVAAGHRAGLAVAQKNTAQLGTAGRTRVGFDFAVAEECQVYRECGSYTRAYGRHVIEIEYTDNGRAAFGTACRLRGRQISILLRDRDVVPRGQRGYVYRTC